MIEHCISSLKSNNEEKSFRIYVTDALMAIAKNTTHILGAQGVIDYGTTINKRWIEVIAPKDNDNESDEPVDDRSSEKIAEDIWSRIRGN